MDGKHQRRLTSEHQRHLDVLRRGEADTAEQVAKSREAVEDSLALLRPDRIEGEGRSPNRAAPKKTRPRRSGA